jgi:predicted double-glycine peptidase
MRMHHRVVVLTVSLAMGACAPTHTSTSTRYVRSLLEARQDRVVVQKWDLSCGAAALATVLTYDLDRPTTERNVAASLLKRYHTLGQVQRQLGFSLLDLKSYANHLGLKAVGYGDVSLHDLVELGPSIIPVQMNGFNHFVVFRGIHGSRVLVADPGFGNRTMHLDYFTSIWQGRMAFAVSRADGKPQPRHFWSTSVGAEPVSPRILALEKAAAGIGLDNPTTAAQAPGGTAVAGRDPGRLAGVVAAGGPRSQTPVEDTARAFSRQFSGP